MATDTGPAATVRAFFGHLANADPDAAVALLDPDVEWHNTLMPPMRGERVGQVLRDLDRRGLRVEVQWRNVAEDGDVVLTDRTDVIRAGEWSTAFRVRGSFRVVEGRIVSWEDSFSWLEALASGAVGLVKMLR
jgi:limonene-1,2-epoxide hydrolase